MGADLHLLKPRKHAHGLSGDRHDGLLLPGCLLFLIYGASIGMRTTLLKQEITVFETARR